MQPICQQIRPTLTNISLHESTIPIVSTVLGRLVHPGEITRASHWCEQLYQPVLFGSALHSMRTDQLIDDDPPTLFVTVGPGKGLISLLLQAFSQSTVINAPLLHNDEATLDSALGELWANRVPIHWSPYFEDQPCQRFSLPIYPFVRTVCTATNCVSSSTGDPLIRHTSEKAMRTNYAKEIETCLVSLLGNSLPSKCDGADPSFEQLGIDSLQAITLVELLSQKFHVELPLKILVDYPALAALARRLQQLKSSCVLNGEGGIPFVYQAHANRRSLSDLTRYITNHREKILAEFRRCGALLFRGFAVDTPDAFTRVIELFAEKNRTFHYYRDGISPRTWVTKRVFTPTDYPKQFDMTLHNELSYSTTMPSMIFFCQSPSADDHTGATPIGDSAATYQGIDVRIREEFIRKGLLYVTNLPSRTNSMIDKSWQDTCQTESKAEVEHFLHKQRIEFQWQSKDVLEPSVEVKQCEGIPSVSR